MEIINVDRTAENHGRFRGTVKLTYDEIVLISNALYLSRKSDDTASRREAYEKLRQNWRAFEAITCHGDISRLEVKE